MSRHCSARGWPVAILLALLAAGCGSASTRSASQSTAENSVAASTASSTAPPASASASSSAQANGSTTLRGSAGDHPNLCGDVPASLVTTLMRSILPTASAACTGYARTLAEPVSGSWSNTAVGHTMGGVITVQVGTGAPPGGLGWRNAFPNKVPVVINGKPGLYIPGLGLTVSEHDSALDVWLVSAGSPTAQSPGRPSVALIAFTQTVEKLLFP